MWKKFFIKVVIVLVMFAALSIFLQVFQPQLSNEAALNQMQNANGAFIANQFVQTTLRWLWVIPTGITILLFIPEIKFLVKKTKEEYSKIEGEDEEQ